METRLQFAILPQPDDFTCGPTCLQAVYAYHGHVLPLRQMIEEVPRLAEGGTLAVLLGCHALRQGFRARLYTYDLQMFDPTWFSPGAGPLAGKLAEKLAAQAAAKDKPKLQTATDAYLEFLQRGGEISMEDLTTGLIRNHLKRELPILTGLSATYLYRTAREHGPNFDPDDVRGSPAGHFVVLCGYDPASRSVLVADPLKPNPLGLRQPYLVNVDRVLCAILLGTLTYDANLLILQPSKTQPRRRRGDPDRGQ